MGGSLYRTTLGNGSWELVMGPLAFASKIRFPSTNSLFRFHVSDCLHLHPLDTVSDSELLLKEFSRSCFLRRYVCGCEKDRTEQGENLALNAITTETLMTLQGALELG